MTDTNRDFVADKEREYQLYLIWKSIPQTLPANVAEEIFASDETLQELAKIRTQRQLAEYLKVRPTTISDWNKIPIPEQYKELNWRYWAKKTTPIVVAALLKNIRKHGKAAEVTAWMKYVEQAEERSTVELKAWSGLADLVKDAEKVLEEHGETI